MQGETQEAAATSSPDPLTLSGPQDRDIDVHRCLPKSSGSCEAWKQNQYDVFQALLGCGRAGIALGLVMAASLQQKERKNDYRTLGEQEVPAQPDRI
jgi:hypothetical protein